MTPCSTLMESEVKQLPQALNTDGIDADQSLPLPGTEAYESLPQFPKRSALPFRRTIRRKELRQIVPLAETTIYEMERSRRVPTSLQPDPALRRVGPGRSGSVDRAAQASSSQRRLEARCPPTENPPCPGGFE